MNRFLLLILCLYCSCWVHLDQATEEFEQDALQAHNKYREIHAVPAMKLNSEMNKMAEAWAENMAELGTVTHSESEERNGDGENIYSGCGLAVTGAGATKEWYKEVCDYDFDANKSAGGAVGQFTQVVWKDSLELGMGKATKDDCTYVVARYKPPGNWFGKEGENVFKGTFDKAFCNGGGKQSLKKKGKVSPRK